MITYEEFIDKFQPIRNNINLVAPLNNMMFENDLFGDQMEYVESRPLTQVWSYNPERGLINGLHYGSQYLGYIICKKDCMFKPGTIKIKM